MAKGFIKAMVHIIAGLIATGHGVKATELTNLKNDSLRPGFTTGYFAPFPRRVPNQRQRRKRERQTGIRK